MHNGSILVIDDDPKIRGFLTAFLQYKGHQVTQASDAIEALELLGKVDVDLVITDLMMPKLNGLELIKKLKAVHPDIVVIVCSAFSNFEMTTNLLKAGAFFCLDKPFNLEDIEAQVNRGLEHRMLQGRNFKGRPVVKNRSRLEQIVGESEKMLSLLELVEKVAETDSTVLIQGESGTGKELVAWAIHALSKRREGNFVPVNCAAIPDDLLESELFGHTKGAFTGAVTDRIGRFEMADRGTIFLDEIGDMKSSLQVKLLRVLQSREVEPVGGMQSRKINARFIAATNQNLEQMVENKHFREDLYYRLSVVPIVIPPLRERTEDIPLLAESFIKRMNTEKKKRVQGISRDAMRALCSYSWPGNIRELENLIERLIIIKGSGTITVEDLPDKYVGRIVRNDVVSDLQLPVDGLCLNSVVEEFETRLITEALLKSGGNKKEAAQLLNLKRTTFIEKLKKRNISPEYLATAS